MGAASIGLLLGLLALMVCHHWAFPWATDDSGPVFFAILILAAVSGAFGYLAIAGDPAEIVLGLVGQVGAFGIAWSLHRDVHDVWRWLEATGERIEAWGATRSRAQRLGTLGAGVVLTVGLAIAVTAVL